MTEPDAAAAQEERAVHYEVELAQDNGEGWRIYDTTPSLEWAGVVAQLIVSRGSKARIRRVEAARRVEVVETIGVGEGA
jgi:hypothetical protein